MLQRLSTSTYDNSSDVELQAPTPLLQRVPVVVHRTAEEVNYNSKKKSASFLRKLFDFFTEKRGHGIDLIVTDDDDDDNDGDMISFSATSSYAKLEEKSSDDENSDEFESVVEVHPGVFEIIRVVNRERNRSGGGGEDDEDEYDFLNEGDDEPLVAVEEASDAKEPVWIDAVPTGFVYAQNESACVAFSKMVESHRNRIRDDATTVSSRRFESSRLRNVKPAEMTKANTEIPISLYWAQASYEQSVDELVANLNDTIQLIKSTGPTQISRDIKITTKITECIQLITRQFPTAKNLN